MNDDSSNIRNQKWWPLLGIGAALLIWAVLLALGAYWAPAGDQPGHDRRKLWVVAATTGGFLALWGLALWLARRQKRGSRRDRTGNAGPPIR